MLISRFETKTIRSWLGQNISLLKVQLLLLLIIFLSDYLCSCYVLGHSMKLLILFLKVLLEEIIQFYQIKIDSFHYLFDKEFSCFVTFVERIFECTENFRRGGDNKVIKVFVLLKCFSFYKLCEILLKLLIIDSQILFLCFFSLDSYFWLLIDKL